MRHVCVEVYTLVRCLQEVEAWAVVVEAVCCAEGVKISSAVRIIWIPLRNVRATVIQYTVVQRDVLETKVRSENQTCLRCKR